MAYSTITRRTAGFPAHRRIPLIDYTAVCLILRDTEDTCDRGGRAPRRPAPAPLPTVAWTRFHTLGVRRELLYLEARKKLRARVEGHDGAPPPWYPADRGGT
eukprot:scaffold22259_cov112-Isochrysis_galbana.AAC.1